MLREHGVHRPSVFELLDTVHRMRGSKSQFHYSHRVAPPLSPSKIKPAASPNPLDSTISYRAAPQAAMNAKMTITPSISPSKNAGVQARDKVLEAIAPMRRGRPTRTSEDSASTSTSTSKEQWLNDNFEVDEDDAWKSAMKTASSSKPTVNKDDAWSVPSQTAKAPGASQGFGDDFSKTQWDGKIRTADVSSSPPVSKSTTAKPPSLGASATLGYSSAKSNSKKDRDAFEGLGLAVSDNKPAPTLGEARKLRTGLATMTTTFYNSSVGGYAGSNGKPYPQPMRPSPSPQPHLQPPQTSALKPSSSGSSWQALRPPSRPASSQPVENATPESRFPSLEELDAHFGGNTKSAPDIGKLSSSPGRSDPHSRVHEAPSTGLARRASSRMAPPSASRGQDGIRSEQVTGYAMRESRKEPTGDYKVYESKRHERPNGAPPSSSDSSFQRSPVVRKQRSAEMRPKVKETLTSSTPSRPPATPSSKASSSTKTPRLPPRPSPSNKDWLTGDDDEIEKIPSHYTTPARPSDAPQPVLRQSPTKRASYIEKSSISIPEASVAQHDHVPLPPPSPLSTAPSENTEMINRANRVFPPLEINTDRNAPPLRSPGLTDNWSPVAAKMPQTKDPESSSSADEGPEDVSPSPQPKPVERRTRKGRQSSVHDLVDLWGGGAAMAAPKEKEKESTRSTITPITPKTPTTKAQRRTTMMVGSTLTESKHDRPSALLLSNDPGRTPQPMKSRTASGRHEKQPSSAAPSPSPISPRGRPQSMFIFPSTDSPAPSSATSSGLSAPDEPKPRTARRTSINDMVQKFEAIDASARVFGSKATSLKSPTENGRLPSIPTGGARSEHAVPMKATLPVPEEAMQMAPVTRTSPRPISPLGQKHIVPPPRTSSIKPAPARKLTVDDTRNAQGEVRSPSPEKPYQGVGKLIDQWQRKAAEPEIRSPTPKRGGLVVKRAGLVSGGAGRS